MLYISPFITVYCCALAIVLGACFGSFLNCMAWRIVHGQSVLRGRSHCDECGHILGAGDLVPIFSFIIHGGKCRYCGKKLPLELLAAEIVSAAAFLSLLLRYDVSLQLLEYLLFACVLLASAFADLEGYIIPNRFILAGVVVRAIFVLLRADRVHWAVFSLVGGLGPAGVLLLVVLLMEKLLKKEAMGGGDIKLLFVTGLFLGWKKNILCIFLACIFGILTGVYSMKRAEKKRDGARIPWGPSIAAGTWVTLLFGDWFIDWYWGLF